MPFPEPMYTVSSCPTAQSAVAPSLRPMGTSHTGFPVRSEKAYRLRRTDNTNASRASRCHEPTTGEE